MSLPWKGYLGNAEAHPPKVQQSVARTHSQARCAIYYVAKTHGEMGWLAAEETCYKNAVGVRITGTVCTEV